MPTCYQLVGVPGSGKSTWVNNQEWTSECVVVSTDQFVEDYAKKVGKTYSEVFEEYMSTAVTMMSDAVINARAANKNIIWDQTSTTVNSRARKFRMLRGYEHVAVVFKTPDTVELNRRLANRPGKIIPDFVMCNMIDNFEMPSEEEGFKEIWFAD